MNRRDLIRRGPLALLGTIGAVLGIKAAEKPPQAGRHDIHICVEVKDSHIIKVVTENYRRGGKLREVIQRDRERGL